MLQRFQPVLCISEPGQYAFQWVLCAHSWMRQSLAGHQQLRIGVLGNQQPYRRSFVLVLALSLSIAARVLLCNGNGGCGKGREIRRAFARVAAADERCKCAGRYGDVACDGGRVSLAGFWLAVLRLGSSLDDDNSRVPLLGPPWSRLPEFALQASPLFEHQHNEHMCGLLSVLATQKVSMLTGMQLERSNTFFRPLSP